MAHQSYFEKLVGKTVKEVLHRDEDPHNETLLFRFDDDTVLHVYPLVPYAIDAVILEPTKSQILAEAARARGIPVVELKLSDMSPSDLVGYLRR